MNFTLKTTFHCERATDNISIQYIIQLCILLDLKEQIKQEITNSDDYCICRVKISCIMRRVCNFQGRLCLWRDIHASVPLFQKVKSIYLNR